MIVFFKIRFCCRYFSCLCFHPGYICWASTCSYYFSVEAVSIRLIKEWNENRITVPTSPCWAILRRRSSQKLFRFMSPWTFRSSKVFLSSLLISFLLSRVHNSELLFLFVFVWAYNIVFQSNHHFHVSSCSRVSIVSIARCSPFGLGLSTESVVVCGMCLQFLFAVTCSVCSLGSRSVQRIRLCKYYYILIIILLCTMSSSPKSSLP